MILVDSDYRDGQFVFPKDSEGMMEGSRSLVVKLADQSVEPCKVQIIGEDPFKLPEKGIFAVVCEEARGHAFHK
jgi:hypothetical protein